MLANSASWLGDETVVRTLESHTLGAAVLVEVGKSHENLATALGDRRRLRATLDRLSADLAEIDDEFDSSARALRGFLRAFAEVAVTPQLAEAYTDADSLLFPDGLAVTKRSYLDEHGVVLEIEKRITADTRELLAATRIGTRSLADVYNQWIEAGKRLGEAARRRALLQSTTAQTSDHKPSIDTKEARLAWIQTVRVFLGVVDLLPLTDDERRSVLGQLRHAVDDSLRSRARSASNGDAIGDADPVDGEPVGADAPDGEPIPADGTVDGEPAAGLEPILGNEFGAADDSEDTASGAGDTGAAS